MEALSLGNIGEASSTCTHQFLGITREEKHSCSVGVMTGIKEYGIIRSETDDYDYCGEPINDCQVSKDILETFSETCEGQESCLLNLS